MAELRCPMCGNVVASDLEICPHCQARLKPLLAASEQPAENLNPASESDRPAPQTEPAAEGSNVPDWLQQLRGEPGIQKMESGPESEEAAGTESILPENMPAPGPEQDLKDWLAGLKEPDQSLQTSQEKDQVEEDGSQLGVEASRESGIDSGEADEWLGRLNVDQAANASNPEESSKPVEQGPAEESQVENPPLADSESSQEAPAMQQEDIPDWLLRLQAETRENAALEPEPTEKPGEEGTLETPAGGALTGAGAKEGEALPHIQWPDRSEEVISGDQGTEAGADKPDWQKESSLDIPALSDELEPLPEEKPEWVQFEQTSDASISDHLPEDGTLPEPVPGEEPLDLGAVTLSETMGASGEMAFPNENEQVPEWLQDVDAGAGEPASQEPGATLDEGLIVPPAAEDETPPDAAELEMPDWVASLRPEDVASKPAEEPPASEEGPLAEAKIPAWVQDMKPLDSLMEEDHVLDGNLAGVVEMQGPLAGLQGVLPASPGLGKPRKPLNYTSKLRVSDDQHQQVADLEKMVSGEAALSETGSPHKKPFKGVLRWVISLALGLAILLPAITGFSFSPAPQNYPPELVAAREVLFGLPKDSAVLLVFAYQPAYTSELEAAGLPLAGNLLSTGIRLAAVSTLPTGPALAEHFLSQAEKSQALPDTTLTTNLGYLAGGASGVLKFAMDPVTTLPNSLSGCQPWSCLLKDVKSLSDFGALVVMTDDPDQARTWIEQASPYLGDKPLVMVISAQAEPLVRPYYESGQVKGLVTGLAGGKAYEQALQIPGLSSQYWNAFSIAMFVAEAALVIGGIWSLVVGLRKLKSTERGQA